jgi:DNA-directed RNA polymerase sigma subunit (sigma70/sigma32)
MPPISASRSLSCLRNKSEVAAMTHTRLSKSQVQDIQKMIQHPAYLQTALADQPNDMIEFTASSQQQLQQEDVVVATAARCGTSGRLPTFSVVLGNRTYSFVWWCW